jgi:CRP-like cAMP-binding protein
MLHKLSKKRLKEYYSFTEKEVNFCFSHFKEVRIKKRQFIVQPGFIVRHNFYVVKGVFRAYIIGKKGQEVTVFLAIDNCFINDTISYLNQQPATMIIEALENSVILRIDFEDEQMLKTQSHKFETFVRHQLEKDLVFKQQRITARLTLTADERYRQFAKNYPLLLQRVPQFAIASYLGMTSQYLSKIKNKTLK